MVGYSEKGWLRWKMRRGKWPDLGLNPFPFHFSVINNPPNNTIHPQPHTLDPTSTPHIATSFPPHPSRSPRSQQCSRRNLLEEEYCCAGSSSAVERDREWERCRRRWGGDGKWKGGDEDGSIFGWLSLEGSLCPSRCPGTVSLDITAVPLDPTTAELFGVAQFTESGSLSIEAIQQKHSTHRPSNQWGAAGLPD